MDSDENDKDNTPKNKSGKKALKARVKEEQGIRKREH